MPVKHQHIEIKYSRVLLTLLISIAVFFSTFQSFPSAERKNPVLLEFNTVSPESFLSNGSYDFHNHKQHLPNTNSEGEESEDNRNEQDLKESKYELYKNWISIRNICGFDSSKAFSFYTQILNTPSTYLYILFHSWKHFLI